PVRGATRCHRGAPDPPRPRSHRRARRRARTATPDPHRGFLTCRALMVRKTQLSVIVSLIRPLTLYRGLVHSYMCNMPERPDRGADAEGLRGNGSVPRGM